MRSIRSTGCGVLLLAGGLVFSAWCTGAACKTGNSKALSDAERDAFIGLAMRSTGLPGLQTGVIKNGKIVWMKSYGYAPLPYARQQVVHEPFDRYVEHAILKPLGMLSTRYWLAGAPIERYALTNASVRQSDGGYQFFPAQAYWAHRNSGGSILDHLITCPDCPWAARTRPPGTLRS